jgi:hypothetical protein
MAGKLLGLRWPGGRRGGRWHVWGSTGQDLGECVEPRFKLRRTQGILLTLLGKQLLAGAALGAELFNTAIDIRHGGSLIGDVGVLPL